MDLRFEKLMTVLVSVLTGRRFQQKDFAFRFGDTPDPDEVQTLAPTTAWQKMKMVAMMWTASSRAEKKK